MGELIDEAFPNIPGEPTTKVPLSDVYRNVKKNGYAGAFGWSFYCDPATDTRCVTSDVLGSALRATLGTAHGGALPSRPRVGQLFCGDDGEPEAEPCVQGTPPAPPAPPAPAPPDEFSNPDPGPSQRTQG